MTNSPAKRGPLRGLRGSSQRTPSENPLRDPKTSQNLSELLPHSYCPFTFFSRFDILPDRTLGIGDAFPEQVSSLSEDTVQIAKFCGPPHA